MNTENKIIWHEPISVPEGQQVLGYNPEWIDEDYNPQGICICWYGIDGEWCISVWCGVHDQFHTRISNEINPNHSTTIAPPTMWAHLPESPSITS